MAEIKTGVIYLLKDKLQCYSPFTGRVLEARFGPEIIRDLDVLNSALLENAIKGFVSASKTPPCNLIIVLADGTYFMQDFLIKDQKPATPEVTKELIQEQITKFVEHVPFDNVVSKTLPIATGTRVIATNQDYYEAVVLSFEHLEFKVDSVIPGLVFGNGLSARPVLDPQMANQFIQKANALRQYTFLGQQVFQPDVKQETEEIDEVEIERTQPKKQDKKRLYALVGVFCSLIVILVIVYVQTQAPPPPKQPALASTGTNTASQQLPQSAPLATATPTLSAAVTSTSSGEASQYQDLTVQIVNTATSANTAQSLMGMLNTYKFKSVTLQVQSSTSSSGTLVSFSPQVSQNIRDAVLGEVKKLETNVIVQEKQIGIYDITIVLGE